MPDDSVPVLNATDAQVVEIQSHRQSCQYCEEDTSLSLSRLRRISKDTVRVQAKAETRSGDGQCDYRRCMIQYGEPICLVIHARPGGNHQVAHERGK